jgi:chemotaxis protein MotC
MKFSLYCVALSAVAAFAVPLPAWGETEEPYQLVRTLERVQDRIAEGNAQAHNYQRQFIAETAEKLLAASDATWESQKNVRSAIVYVLSGGDPRILKKLLAIPKLPSLNAELLKGVLAYAEGRNQEALELLSEIDHLSFDSRTGGHLALAKAMVAAPQDAARAVVWLDEARLLCPGTLVEEAALRREVLLLSNLEDYQRFELLSIQYLRRFPKSIYAKNFSRSFAIATASGKYGSDPKLMGRLEKRLDDFDDDTRRELYMALAEQGVTRGRVELTRMAADKIGHLVKDGGRDSIRLQLYKAAALVVTPEYEFALARLRMIDRTKLGSNDARLLDNAIALALEVRQPPRVNGPIKELPPLASATQVKHGAIAEKSDVLDRARLALSQAEQLLNKDRR